MKYKKEALIHPFWCFKRGTILERKKRLHLTNEARIELFIWDLEIFAQIYKRLGNHVILKGGTAAQLYFPVERQRTSIDIDMICNLNKNKIESCLKDIEESFQGEGNLLKFRSHKPKTAKTELPLMTYYITVPSEIIKSSDGKNTQEIKIEFFLNEYEWPAVAHKKPVIFALETSRAYRVLSLEGLIADKLTTIGPNSIGIPLDRRDEICKHIYDLDGLLRFANDGDHNIYEVLRLYRKRSQLECKSRKIPFNFYEISKDALQWLAKLSTIDFERNTFLEKDINDFQSLYLRKSINRGKSQWAIIGDKLRFYLVNLYRERPLSKAWQESLLLESMLAFNEVEGMEKGKIIRQFKESFSSSFEKYSIFPRRVLKGKMPIRQMWHVIKPENIPNLKEWIEEFKNKNI